MGLKRGGLVDARREGMRENVGLNTGSTTPVDHAAFWAGSSYR